MTLSRFDAGKRIRRYLWQQLGKPYVWDTAGPLTFDCSGLALAAWATCGVDLPHNARQQSVDQGVDHVPLATAVAGDLLFYYQPIEHVAVFTGSHYRPDGHWHSWCVAATDVERGIEHIEIDAYAPVVLVGRPRLQQ